MNRRILIILFLPLLLSCEHRNYALISGQILNVDSVVMVYTPDSVYRFLLDENDFFSGKIELNKGGYASFFPGGIDLYLMPGENLELYGERINASMSFNFMGNLGGINNYMHEQQKVAPFKKENYLLDEPAFIILIDSLCGEYFQLLEAKHFNRKFTMLEKRRITYMVKEWALPYPFYHALAINDTNYRPSDIFIHFIQDEIVEKLEMVRAGSYRRYLLDYIYYKEGMNYQLTGNSPERIVDYILQNIQHKELRGFLLSESLFRYGWENNGIEGAEKLLNAVRENEQRYSHVESAVVKWENILPGCIAPEFTFEEITGKQFDVASFKGVYLYICVWTTWCEPCEQELAYITALSDRYKYSNLIFLNVSLDVEKDKDKWKEFVQTKGYGGRHGMIHDRKKFGEDYMIGSVPRFIMIDPEGRIVSANAARPSANIDAFFDSLGIVAGNK